ncbi:MAG: hypothetical protein A2018_05745 [Alphaproteobacteria bacterium GWF2_58_20]|nr:MAG: hypothetical protein A2018_05745 [Alphaproteobacteria bacterium GWF2_58_20]
MCWYDAGTGLRKRRSLGTTVRAEAERLLAEHALRNQKLNLADPDCVPLATILASYADKHACKIASAATAAGALAKLLDFFGDSSVSDLRLPRQEEYIAWRRKDGVSDSTISRDLSVLRAALNRAYRAGDLRSVPHILDLPKARPRERWLTHEEAKRLLEETTTPHVRLFITLALHTAARPGALFDLTWDRVDLKNRRIDLNPAGRAQTKKRRPTIPISNTLLVVLEDAQQVARSKWVIDYEGKQIQSVKTAFQKTAKRARLEKVTAYTLRHTAATWMAQAGVPLWQISGMLGHSISRTTEIYAKHHPDFMKDATAALDRIWDGF